MEGQKSSTGYIQTTSNPACSSLWVPLRWRLEENVKLLISLKEWTCRLCSLTKQFLLFPCCSSYFKTSNGRTDLLAQVLLPLEADWFTLRPHRDSHASRLTSTALSGFKTLKLYTTENWHLPSCHLYFPRPGFIQSWTTWKSPGTLKGLFPGLENSMKRTN